MANKLSGWDDTIVALATAPGISAISVIRLSGNNSIPIINKLFPSKDLSSKRSHTLHVGVLQTNGEPIDEVVVSLFKGPKSYTGEDVVEISCHGSPYIQEKIINTCIAYGARLAKPGEFTQRAFLHAKLDLTQAEAVADLILSNTQASQKTALNNVRGGFSHQLMEMREQLIQFASLIELELDFAEEDVAFADRKQLYSLIAGIDASVKMLINSFQLGNVIKNGVSVAIIGKPNAGKSTLLNTLLNENRAIVSEIAGTTRDTIEEVININGILFRLIDTAGIREHSTDTIELEGIEKSLEKMRSADIVLYIFDVNETTAAELVEKNREFIYLKLQVIPVGNKIDVDQQTAIDKKFECLEDIRFISAKDNSGIDALKNEIFNRTVQQNPSSENIVITNARHLEALKQVEKSLSEITFGLNENRSGDLLAADIRTCLYHLGEITGEVTNEDKLDYIFSKFCIGK